MANKKLKIELTGAFEDQQHVRLSEFAGILNAINGALEEIDRSISENKKPSVYYRLIDVTHASPTTLSVEAIPIEPDINNGEAVYEQYITDWGNIIDGKKLEKISPELLGKYNNIASRINGYIPSAVFSLGERRVEIDKTQQSDLSKAIEEDWVLMGSFSGKMDAIYIHGKRNFRIWPKVGPTSILCHFPEELQENVIKAIDRNVDVQGKLRYKHGESYPSEVNVTKIEILGDDETLPSLADLRGRAPKATGDMSSEEFIRRKRQDKW